MYTGQFTIHVRGQTTGGLLVVLAHLQEVEVLPALYKTHLGDTALEKDGT